MLAADKFCSVCDFIGRLRLYAILLNHFFPWARDFLSFARAQKLPSPERYFLINLIVPENLYEVNNRLKMLMRAATVIVNQMMEGQKRLCAQIYNEAGVIPKDQPIPSFVRWPQEVHKKIDRSHLKLKDNWEEFIKEGNKSFFSRSSVGIRVFLYNGRKESPFLSIGQVFIIHWKSHEVVDSYSLAQKKEIVAYLVMILQTMIEEHGNEINSTIVPNMADAHRYGGRPREKWISFQTRYMANLFLDVTIRLAQKNIGLKELVEAYRHQAVTWFKNYKGGERYNKKSGKKGRFCADNDDNFELEDERKEHQIAHKGKHNDKWEFSDDDSYPPHIAATKWPWRQEELKDEEILKPDTVAFEAAKWFAQVKEASGIAAAPHTVQKTWTPKGMAELMVITSNVVYDLQSAQLLIALYECNGTRKGNHTRVSPHAFNASEGPKYEFHVSFTFVAILIIEIRIFDYIDSHGYPL